MARDAILDKYIAERDRLEATLQRMQGDGVGSSSYGQQWSATRIEISRIRGELNLVRFKILQRGAFLNGRNAIFGASSRRIPVVRSESEDS